MEAVTEIDQQFQKRVLLLACSVEALETFDLVAAVAAAVHELPHYHAGLEDWQPNTEKGISAVLAAVVPLSENCWESVEPEVSMVAVPTGCLATDLHTSVVSVACSLTVSLPALNMLLSARVSERS